MPSNTSRSKSRSKSAGQVRIIGGSLRGRKLDVGQVEGLRPTGDRMRETLFNWLQTQIAGSRCLDLFAGTGALGIEAVSRGAAAVTLVEKDATAAASLAAICASWPHENRLNLRLCSAEQFLANAANSETVGRPAGGPDRVDEGGVDDSHDSSAQGFDIVFIDPPFGANLQLPMLAALTEGHLADGALVYIEAPADTSLASNLPAEFVMVKQRQYGEVTALLVEYVG